MRIYIYIYVCLSLSIYIYIHMVEPPRSRAAAPCSRGCCRRCPPRPPLKLYLNIIQIKLKTYRNKHFK